MKISRFIIVGAILLIVMSAASLGYQKDNQPSSVSIDALKVTAEKGDRDAQFNLGVMYDRGDGVTQDYIQAHMWFNIAAATSTAESREFVERNRDSTAEKMTSEQIAEAQRLAKEWMERRK